MKLRDCSGFAEEKKSKFTSLPVHRPSIPLVSTYTLHSQYISLPYIVITSFSICSSHIYLHIYFLRRFAFNFPPSLAFPTFAMLWRGYVYLRRQRRRNKTHSHLPLCHPSSRLDAPWAFQAPITAQLLVFVLLDIGIQNDFRFGAGTAFAIWSVGPVCHARSARAEETIRHYWRGEIELGRWWSASCVVCLKVGRVMVILGNYCCRGNSWGGRSGIVRDATQAVVWGEWRAVSFVVRGEAAGSWVGE